MTGGNRSAVPMAGENRSVDPITLEILSHRLFQITKEMSITLERVGGTVNTTQMKDYIAALYRPNGDVLCAGEAMLWHVPCAGMAVKRIIERFERDGGIFPDDIFMLNDPYSAAIHQSDIYVVSPIHFGDRLVGWSATFVHVMDIGALSPGGNSPEAREIVHEGVRIAGIKLVERGQLRKDVFDAITNMTRQPMMVGLDLKCEIAANNVAKTRIREVCGQYGPDLLDAVCGEMVRYSEAILRRRIAELPDDRWTAAGSIHLDETWNLRLTLRKRGDGLVFDFTGSDPQARIGINLPYHATVGACFEAVLTTLGYDLPKNQGTLRMMEVVAPEGSIVNPRYPAPVSLNTTSGGAVARYLANSALSQMVGRSGKWRTQVMSHSLGSRLLRHAGISQHGQYYVSTIIGLSGGGARFRGDGIDSGGIELGRPSSTHNVEWVEMNFPLLHLFRRHIRDGGGAGRFRGGCGEETALVLHDSPEGAIQVVALGVAGLRNSGQGVGGGHPGALSLLVHLRDTTVRDLVARGRLPDDVGGLGGEARLLPYCTIDFRKDDVLVMRYGNGGGYGDPLERDPRAVLRDVELGLVSAAAAEELYRVVIRGRELDLAETDRKRAELREERLTASEPPRSRSAVEGRMDPAWCCDGGRIETAVTTPLQVNVEMHRHGNRGWIRCARCRHVLCEGQEEWTGACRRSVSPPTKAGPLMRELIDQFWFVQLYCPACGALMQSDIVDRGREP